MYYRRFPEESKNAEKQIEMYQNRIRELQRYIINGKVIDESVLDKLQEKLQEFESMLEELKREDKTQ